MIIKYGLLLLAYLLGSIPFSVILGRKYRGIDIREHGSGNPGGTNSLRFLGKKIGYTVLFLDGLKAGLIVLLITTGIVDGSELLNPLAYGIAAAFGHVYSIFLKFKGGKAVAATVGIMVAYNLLYAFIMMIVFSIVLRIWKYVSVSSASSVFAVFIIGLVIGFTTSDWNMPIYMSLLLLLVIFRHKKNFSNIKNGIEPKVKLFDKKKENSI
jgi:glycerol-3-phosphate acyltransferase PlsY